MARWTDLAEWVGPSVNTGDGDSKLNEPEDGMYEYNGVVEHIAAGWYLGTIAWQRNADANVSSHFIIGRKEGQAAQMVDTDIRAWTQGQGNGRWISIENEGFPASHPLWKPGWERLTDWQIERSAQIFARGHQVYGYPLQLTNHPHRDGLGYHGMGAEQGFQWGHLHCPGEPIKAQLPLILARASEIVSGNTKGDSDMLLIKTADDPTVYVSDGHRYRPLGPAGAEAAFNAAISAGHRVATVASLAELEAIAGKPVGAPVPPPPVDVAELAEALAARLPTAAQIAAAMGAVGADAARAAAAALDGTRPQP